MPRYFLTCPRNPFLHVELFADGSNTYAIGRGYENNLILVRNKLISRRHCQLFKENDNSVRLMADTDVNGVVINERLLILSGESITLSNDDEFYIVHSRKQPDKNLSLILSIERTVEDDEKERANKESGTAALSLPGNSNIDIATEPSQDKSKSDDKNDSSASATPTNEKPSEPPGASTATKAALKPEVQLSSSLQCSICLSILYDPVTLSPCMHNFCSGCCSGWLATNRRCPSCRNKISLLSKNPSLRAILDAYVAANPSAAKSTEEKEMLDAANRLNFDRPFVSGSCLPLNERGGDLARRGGGAADDANASDNTNNTTGSSDLTNSSDSDDSDEDILSLSDNDNSDSDDSDDHSQEGTGWPLGSDTEIEENDIPERHEFDYNGASAEPVCAQCVAPSNSCAKSGNDSTEAGKSTGGPGFHCTDPLRHVLCNCCENPMPDRRTDKAAPIQTCWICSLEYCNLYWPYGCQNGNCSPGCLKLLKDIDLGQLIDGDINAGPPDASVAVLLFGNNFEVTQLRAHVGQNSISASGLRDDLLNGLDSGKYPVTARTLLGRKPDRNTPVCSYCRLRIVQDLLFAYRRHTRDASADRRPNCPHGRYCISQSQDMTHATVVNHICDPTPPGIVFDAATFSLTTADSLENEGGIKPAKISLPMDLD